MKMKTKTKTKTKRKQETISSSSSSSLRSSSYRQEHSPGKNLQAKSIGCMSGIFHLIYKYNNRRGKFITSGKRQDKNSTATTTTTTTSSSSSSSSKQQRESSIKVHNNNAGGCGSIGDGNDVVIDKNINNFTRLTCDVPRSPTLPAEIRRGNGSANNHDMEMAAAAEVCLGEAAEKRRRLIEALEKCDEDLKELKKIIDVVRSSVTAVDRANRDDDSNKINGHLQPIPVPVLDHDFAPNLSSSAASYCYPRRYANGRAAHLQKQPQRRSKPGEGDTAAMALMMGNSICLVEKMTKSEALRKRWCSDDDVLTAAAGVMSPMWGSKAMIESVDQVCTDIAWGESREAGRIGLALQDYICRDLIDEFVKELFGSFCKRSLPFDACRRRLRF